MSSARISGLWGEIYCSGLPQSQYKHEMKAIIRRKNKFWLIKKIRNGIAHQNIKGINENDKWIGVRLWNNTNTFKKDFEIIFTIEELKSLAIALSDKYLEKRHNKVFHRDD